jgi:transcription elongation factor GreA
MPEEKKYYLTKEGLEKIKKEHQDLKVLRLAKAEGEVPKILQSEDINPEYLSFQEDINFLESRMTELDYILKNAELIKAPQKTKQGMVGLGATVTVELDGEIDEFTIVGSLETDPINKKISNESPIGQALMGRKVGEAAVVKTPIVNHSFKVVKIKYNRI